MPWDGNGNFTRTDGVFTGADVCTQQANNGVGLVPGRFDAELNNLVEGLEACLARNGETAATGNLNLGNFRITNLAAGTANNEAIVLSQLIDRVPIGSWMGWLTNTPPSSNWFLMQGQAISRTVYSVLFALWGTTFGAGDGSTTFNLPDFRGRFSLFRAAAGTGSVLGATGGSLDHTHTQPAHTHAAGTLRAQIGISTGNSRLTMIRDGAVTFSATGATDPTAGDSFSWTGINTQVPDTDTGVAVPTSVITGATASDGAGNTGANNPAFIVSNAIVRVL